jgi:hypothetical protein
MGVVDDTETTETPDLNELIGEWLDWSQASDRLHVSVSKVRQLIREHQLGAAVPVPGQGQKVPAATRSPSTRSPERSSGPTCWC